MLFGSALFFGGIGGLVVAAILKRLDNIVKEYSTATSNVLQAILCSFLFPEKFQLTVYIMLSMCLLFVGIYMYETHKALPSFPNKQQQTNNNKQTTTNKQQRTSADEDTKAPILKVEIETWTNYSYIIYIIHLYHICI